MKFLDPGTLNNQDSMESERDFSWLIFPNGGEREKTRHTIG